MLVLAILAAIAGMSWPALMRPWSRTQIQQAAHDLATQLGNARLRAVEESRVYELRWRPGTGDYQISSADTDTNLPLTHTQSSVDDLAQLVPNDPQAAEPSASSVQGDSPKASLGEGDGERVWRVPPVWSLQTSLLSGARFVNPHAPLEPESDVDEARLGELAAPDDPANGLPTEADATDTPESLLAGDAPEMIPWAPTVWIYPDGRTSNAHWTLTSDEGYEVAVDLRGLTGSVRIGPVRRQPPRLDENDNPPVEDGDASQPNSPAANP